MKLNKKGITSVELLVSFIIVSTIVVSMFNLIMNYRNKEQIEEINNEVISFSNNLQEEIQSDQVRQGQARPRQQAPPAQRPRKGHQAQERPPRRRLCGQDQRARHQAHDPLQIIFT